MSSVFHNADMRTHRRVILTSSVICAALVLGGFFLKQQPGNKYVLVKADRLVRTAATPLPAK
jgi:hypothetical protein